MTLLVLAPMAIEEAALRTKSRVLRTGMGPERARIAAARALAIDARSVAIAGLCGGVDPALMIQHVTEPDAPVRADPPERDPPLLQ